jgi:hypothetical protein
MRRWRLFVGAILLAIGCTIFALTRCGSVIEAKFNRGKSFDFANPPCHATVSVPLAQFVDIRYLGAGGVYIGLGNDAVLMGPFFSNPGLLTAAFGKFKSNDKRIRHHLHDVPLANVKAIVVGHSHYDHIADIPVVAAEHTSTALIFANEYGVKMLNAYPSLRSRTREVKIGQPIRILNESGQEVIRIYPVVSDHAPQLCKWRRWPCEFANCKTEQAWTTAFNEHRINKFCGGQTFAFVIDFMKGDRIAYRLYYNDAAAEAPLGIPPISLTVEHPYDVAIICVASYDFVNGYPEQLVSSLDPRHLIYIHYEDFFSRSENHWHFAPLLTNGRANAFFDRLAHIDYRTPAVAPVRVPCGVSSDRWTMPVPGSQILFDMEQAP